MVNASVHYWPGVGTGIRHDGLVLVADVVPGEPVSLELLGVVTDGGGIDALLDVLFRNGFASAPDFGIVLPDEDGVRVVVRGAARLDVAGGKAVVGAGAFTDQHVPGPLRATLSIGQAPTGVSIPSSGGLVPAVGWLLNPGVNTVGARPPAASPADEVPVAEGSVAETERVNPVAVAATVEPDAVAPPTAKLDPKVPAAAEDADQSPSVSEVPDLSSYRDLFDPPADPPTEDDDLGSDPSDVRVAEPVATEAPPDEHPPAETLHGAPAPLVTSAPLTHPSAPNGPVVTNAPAFIDTVPFIDGLPTAHPPEVVAPTAVSMIAPRDEAPAAPAFPAPDPEAPDGGHTVNRAEVQRAAAAAQQTVHAKRCVAGHPTQAHVPTCRVCGAVVPDQEVVTIARPVLGRLVLPTGQEYPLDRPVVLGRDPKVPLGHTGETPHLVAIVDPRSEVSGQHALVTVDYWSVEVTDLGSTNGTELVTSDGRRQKLVPRTPVQMEPGARLVLAEILDIGFEAVP